MVRTILKTVDGNEMNDSIFSLVEKLRQLAESTTDHREYFLVNRIVRTLLHGSPKEDEDEFLKMSFGYNNRYLTVWGSDIQGVKQEYHTLDYYTDDMAYSLDTRVSIEHLELGGSICVDEGRGIHSIIRVG